MSTRGLYGFRKDGKDYLTYNHMDSYPTWLGEHVLAYIHTVSTDDMQEVVSRIKLVGSDVQATRKQQEDCISRGIWDGKGTTDWYSVLHNMQGDLSYLRDDGTDRPIYLTNDALFIRDSLFCEWAYVINLDTQRLEVYLGFQRVPDEKNRYGMKKEDGYYPCKLLADLPFAYIRSRNPAKVAQRLEKMGEWDYMAQEEARKMMAGTPA